MAWVGVIDTFEPQDNGWFVIVKYYDDTNPDLVLNRTFNWPLNITKNQALNQIQNKGSEIKAQATINTSAIIGTVVQIP